MSTAWQVGLPIRNERPPDGTGIEGVRGVINVSFGGQGAFIGELPSRKPTSAEGPRKIYGKFTAAVRRQP